MVGRSGVMTLGVRSVQAVDGTEVPIEADLTKQGRSRAGATVAWTLFWGIPGLITRGVNPYMEKGTEIMATVLTEARIEPTAVPAMPGAAPANVSELQITSHKFDGRKRGADVTFDIERRTDLKSVTFEVVPPTDLGDALPALTALELRTVDDVPVPEPVVARSATANAVVFDGWSIIRYCRDGVSKLGFEGRTGDGRVLRGAYQLRVKVNKKG